MAFRQLATSIINSYLNAFSKISFVCIKDKQNKDLGSINIMMEYIYHLEGMVGLLNNTPKASQDRID